MTRPRRPIALAALVAVLLTAALAMAGPASAKKAKSLGPTPLAGDCRFYQRPNGGPECYQDLWSGRFEVGQHVVQVGDTLTAKIQVLGGLFPIYTWPSPGGAGLKTEQCPEVAPTPPEGRNLVGWSTTCTFKAVGKTDGWEIFGPTMGLAISNYPDQDYYAVIGGGAPSSAACWTRRARASAACGSTSWARRSCSRSRSRAACTAPSTSPRAATSSRSTRRASATTTASRSPARRAHRPSASRPATRRSRSRSSARTRSRARSRTSGTARSPASR